jgi:hypothetical protein
MVGFVISVGREEAERRKEEACGSASFGLFLCKSAAAGKNECFFFFFF